MLPRKLDITIALKMINLVPELSGTDKRVCAAIIDHFNCKTTQCDPSVDRIAWLLGVNRRTVIRSVSRLEMIGVLRRLRHGGHLQRNSYEPVWRRFRELEAEWRVRFNAKNLRFAERDMSPGKCHAEHLSGAEPVTQTLRINQSKESRTADDVSKTDVGVLPVACEEQARKDQGKPISGRGCAEIRKWTPPSAEVRRIAAERRWNKALHDHFSSSPEVYGEVIGAIDQEIITAATIAEMDRRGAGIAYILEQLRAQGLRELLGSA
jgi:predicted transcriptional regulator